MKSFIEAFLTYSSRDKKGVLVLTGLLLFLIAAMYCMDYIFEPDTVDFAAFEKDIRTFENSLKKPVSNERQGLRESTIDKAIELFSFNPNHLPESTWKKLGLNQWQIDMIKKYESKGGTFRSKNDFKKMYCIRHHEYDRLEPFLLLPVVLEDTIVKKQFAEKYVRKSVVIDINTADSIGLLALKGIGPAFASRIVKYRKRLGGFYQKEQLKEVYGLDSSRYTLISSFIQLHEPVLQKFNINSAPVAELAKHPYIGYTIASALVNYRKAHGAYKSIADIKKCLLVNEELYLKLVNYITVE